eukprot:CAMPEP_0198251212 /NCGR_PEP_ID=MMETSP1447-20131203/2117_1 /TAXON_ID=420782 /ORGANISM="Chaetoceros dichaeta, Strain CCMP1751" /LENGTH=64 /DNA_ID=CAMNT_0043936177 /DNA_START=139 /DNA_END=333 /DNA_ORIENTATION=+
MPEQNKGFKSPLSTLSSGLGRGGRIGAWVVAIGAVAAWNYYESKDDGQEMSKEEQKHWNYEKKK